MLVHLSILMGCKRCSTTNFVWEPPIFFLLWFINKKASLFCLWIEIRMTTVRDTTIQIWYEYKLYNMLPYEIKFKNHKISTTVGLSKLLLCFFFHFVVNSQPTNVIIWFFFPYKLSLVSETLVFFFSPIATQIKVKPDKWQWNEFH